MRRYEEAREVAHSIRYDWVRWEALRDLAAAMPQAGHHQEAREVARSVRHDEHRAEALKALSAAMARAGSLNYALSLLGLRTLDEFLQILAEWATVFEQIKPRLSIAVLSDATAVAGWVRSDWREIHELLSTPERGEKREAAGEARHKRSRRLASDH